MKKIFIGVIIIIVLLCSLYFMFIRSKSITNKLCKGVARCFEGIVDEVIDGDTLVISGETIRLSLVNTPEKKSEGYNSAKEFSESVCMIGEEAVVDEDDMQISRSHRRVLGVVYCGSINLNEKLLRNGHAYILVDFCRQSEFSDEKWAIDNGC